MREDIIELEPDDDGVYKPVKRSRSKKKKETFVSKKDIDRHVSSKQYKNKRMMVSHRRAADEFLGGFEAGMEVLGQMEKLISKWCR